MTKNLADIHDTSYETLKLLNFIVNNETLCTKQIASILKNNKSERSNLRHFKTIERFFKYELSIEVFERSSRGCYRVINKDTLQHALNLGDRKELLSYIHILKEILPHYYDSLDGKIKSNIESAQKDSSHIYLFHNNPLEDFQNNQVLKTIEKSIEQRRKSTIQYKEIKYENTKPLNIVFMEGNLYLACLTDDEINNSFKFLRIIDIKDYSIGQNEFNDTQKVLEARTFLQEFQTPFTSFQKDYTKVTIIASCKVSRFFLKKKHLPSQEEKVLEDGNLELTYYVTDYMEVSIMIKKWMPDLKIIAPIEWKERLHGELKVYLND